MNSEVSTAPDSNPFLSHETIGLRKSSHESLIPSLNLEHFVLQRTAVLERIKRALQALREAHAIAEAANLGEPRIHIEGLSRNSTPVTASDAPEAARRQVDFGGWSYLMSQSGLLTFMDAKAREEWRKQLEGDDLPPLTPENIVSTFAHVHSARGEMFERGVITLFRRLSPDYKTNQPFKFGKRIILRFLLSYANAFDHVFVNHTAADALDDLLRVFHVVDGKPEPDHRNGFYRLIDQAHSVKQSTLEGEYFHLRWFRKGSCHLSFKRLDLVDHLNHIIAKHHPGALPANHQ
jgi:hypothetical protein